MRGGIRVTMITGDHRITAAAIAKMLGIGDGKTAITGAEIEEYGYRRVIGVRYRASTCLRARARAQAPSGEGNSGQQAGRGDDRRRSERRTLRSRKPTSASRWGSRAPRLPRRPPKWCSTDDNFASITAAVKEGRHGLQQHRERHLFLCCRRTWLRRRDHWCHLFLALPGRSRHLQSWVNMVTSVALDLVVSFEPHELDVMLRSPRASTFRS